MFNFFNFFSFFHALLLVRLLTPACSFRLRQAKRSLHRLRRLRRRRRHTDVQLQLHEQRRRHQHMRFGRMVPGVLQGAHGLQPLPVAPRGRLGEFTIVVVVVVVVGK